MLNNMRTDNWLVAIIGPVVVEEATQVTVIRVSSGTRRPWRQFDIYDVAHIDICDAAHAGGLSWTLCIGVQQRKGGGFA